MAERVKLAKPGEELVMLVLRAQPETIDRTEYWIFTGVKQEIAVPASSVKGRLARMDVAAATDLVGKAVRFARSTKTNQGGKPYWEMDLATADEAKAAGNGASAAVPAPASAGAAGAQSAPPKSYTDLYGKATDYILATILPKYAAAKLTVSASDVRAMVGDLFAGEVEGGVIRRWRNVPLARDPDVPVRERLLVHSYTRATGELVDIWLNESCAFVVYCGGVVIHSESRSKHQGRHTPRTAKVRGLAYEQQDRDEHERSNGNPPPSAA